MVLKRRNNESRSTTYPPPLLTLHPTTHRILCVNLSSSFQQQHRAYWDVTMQPPVRYPLALQDSVVERGAPPLSSRGRGGGVNPEDGGGGSGVFFFQ